MNAIKSQENPFLSLRKLGISLIKCDTTPKVTGIK